MSQRTQLLVLTGVLVAFVASIALYSSIGLLALALPIAFGVGFLFNKRKNRRFMRLRVKVRQFIRKNKRRNNTPRRNRLIPSNQQWLFVVGTFIYVMITVWLMWPTIVSFLVNGSSATMEALFAASFGEQARFFIPAILTALSVVYIPVNRVSTLELWGIPVDVLGPGPKFIPKILFQTDYFPGDVQQRQFPGNPEEVYKEDDEKPLPPNMVRPFRATTGKPKSTNSKDPLAIQMAIEFLYYIRYQIVDPMEFKLKYGSIDGFLSQIRDTGDKLLTKRVAKTAGVAELIDQTAEIMEDLDTHFKDVTRDGGVQIVESGLNAPDLTHELAKALRDIGKLRAQGQGEAAKIREIGKANADAAAILIEKTAAKLADADDAAKIAYAGKEVLGDKTTIIAPGIIQALEGLTTGLKIGRGNP